MNIDGFHPLIQDISSYMGYAQRGELEAFAKDAGAVGECARAELEVRAEFGDDEEE